MKFHVMTLFPDIMNHYLGQSIMGKAMEKGIVEANVVNIRDYTEDKHGKVDDYPYGGGAGMLMQAQPIYDTYVKITEHAEKKIRTVYVTPQGKPFDQKLAREFSKEEEIIFLCGHYEGVDERVLEEIVTDYVSIGDYVLTGGELPVLVMIDAISRLVPGVLHNEFSAETETFQGYLLEYPQYSRPEVWRGKVVPKVLMTGDHKKIRAWRLEQSENRTKVARPDLYAKYEELKSIERSLLKKKKKFIHMIELIRRGRAELLYHKGTTVMLKDTVEDIYSFSAWSREAAGECLEQLRKERLWSPEYLTVVCDPEVRQLLIEEYGMKGDAPCYQYLYTPRETLPVPFKDIRPLTPEHMDYVTEHYHHEADYVKNRIEEGCMYGAFIDGRQVGFIGMHREGSMGMLFVEEAYRHQKIAASLESYLINKHVAEGQIPYCHIYASNDASCRLQEKLGLYKADETLWWMIP